MSDGSRQSPDGTDRGIVDGAIVTVTAAPAVDWTLTLDRLEVGAVHVASGSHREAGGKGINVARALHRAGHATRAVFPAGGDGGRFLVAALTAAGIEHVAVPVSGAVRTNLTVVDPDATTKFNEPGTALTDPEVTALRGAVVAACADARLLLLCGSLPGGLDPDFYTTLTSAARVTRPDLPVWVDTSGPALRAVVAAGPDLVKPNAEELAALTGGPLTTLGDVVAAARDVVSAGAGAVLASVGADGALLVDAAGVLHGSADAVPVVNTVGTGDALLAGFAAATGGREARLREALRWASSCVGSPTTGFDLDERLAARIHVGPVRPDQRLTCPVRA